MRLQCRMLVVWLAAVVIGAAGCLSGQAGPAARAQDSHTPTAQLSPEQNQRFDDGRKAFGEKRYADALIIFKRLLIEAPGNAFVAKFASEAALNTGETSFAVSALKPIAQANADDWQAAALLVRACAESGDVACRNSEMAHMAALHERGVTPASLQQYPVERVKVGANTLLIRMSLVPWGPYKVWALGQVMNADGDIFLRASLESSDADQIFFAKEHPQEAAKGLRQFSLDAYRETGRNSNGQRTQTHYTYKFFVGQPSYDTIREEFVSIAGGKAVPVSSRSNLIVP